jgi:transposase-like protein
MANPISEYTADKADIVVTALAEGRRPASVAKLVGVTRQTLYYWRSQFPEFADQWDHAVAAATDRMEEVV